MKVARDMIDPQLRLVATFLNLMGGNLTVEKMRKSAGKPSLMMKLMTRLFKPKNSQIEEQWIPRDDGSKLRIMVMKPLEPKQDVPGLLCIHGGGYFMGTPEVEAGMYESLFMASDCVIVSPDYRLSVEAPYPAALEDCYTALLWLKENADSLGVRDDQIVVMGGSAGGGLTAATTLYARDKGEVNVAFQMPLFPMIDDRNNTESAKDNNAPGWDAVSNESGWRLYLGDLYGTDNIPAYAAPARATDYSSLPPTYTYVGDLDPLRDETITYIENLKAAGVPADVDVYEGAYHAFDIARKADVTKRAHRRLEDWFSKAVQEYTAPQPD